MSDKRHISNRLSAVFRDIPEEARSRFLIDKKIKITHKQFQEVVDPYILKHTNSVYFLKDKQGEKRLTVYVDDSTCAAELNARRELIKLKYRERFNEVIDVFEIKISRGSYKENHPFQETLEQQEEVQHIPLSEKELTEIDEKVSSISDFRLRESFKKVLIAQKQREKSNL